MLSGTSQPASGALVWHGSEPGAIAEASAEQLPLMVDFTADWCLPCKTLEEEVFQAPAVAAVLRSDFVLLRVDLSGDWDAPDKSALREKYGVVNLPAVRIVSVGGQVVAEIDELIEAEQFLDLLREARSS